MEPDAAVQSPVDSSTTGVQHHEAADSPVVENFTDQERRAWLEKPTDFPKKEAKKADSPPAKEEKTEKEESSPSQAAEKQPEVAAAGEKPAEKASESATEAKTQEQPKGSEAERRIKQLVSEKKALEARLAAAERPPVRPEATETAEKQAPKPDPEKFETLEEYFEALSDWKVKVALTADRAARAEETRKAEVERHNQAVAKTWQERVGEAKKKHADFEAVALSPDLPIAEGSPLDYWGLQSENGAEVLYYYGQHPEELTKLNELHPVAAYRELARVEFSLTGETKKPAPAKVTQVPPPPAEVSTRGGATEDPIAAALASDNVAEYMRLKNAEEQRSRK